MPRGIARKLILWLTVIVVIVEGVFALVNTNAQEHQLLDEMILGADLVSQTMVSSTWHAMLEDRRESAYQMMNNVGHQASIEKVRIFNKEGRIMFSTGTDTGRIVDPGAEACDLCHAAERPLVHVDVPSRARIFRQPGGGRLMGMVTPIYNEPACSEAACHAHPPSIHVLGVIDVTMSLDRVDRQVRDVRFRSILLSVVSVLVLSFFAVILTKRFVSEPVRQLIQATKSVGALDLDRAVDIDAHDEIGALARSFEEMRGRLRESQRQINEFTHTLELRVEERTQQLRATEQKLIQSDRLASLGQLAASVAHEINNPLAGVINFARLMQRLLMDDELPKERVADFRGYLDHVVTETVRSANIVRDLLAFSRQTTPHRSVHDLNAIVKRTLSVIHHRLELGDVVAELDLADDLPEVTCDASQVQQIIMNLVLNAAEAMEDGTVVIRTRFDAGDGSVRLAVSDTGVGIPPENLSKIFDPFFSTKEEGKGTGLGLAVVYGIVNAHGGQIEVASEVGKGTTFTVILPVEPPPSEDGKERENA